MKTKRWTSMIAKILIATLPMTVPLAAQNDAPHKPKHHQYKLLDVGTLGGSNSYFYGGPPLFGILNSRGTVVGDAATTIADPYYPNCWGVGCVVYHAFQYRDGLLIDLGALPGVNSSIPVGINDSGVIAGISENGTVDPLTSNFETRAVVWKNGKILDLGTFGGNVSVASAINSQGTVVGAAANTIPDSFASGLGPCFTYNCSPVATQLHAFVWHEGFMKDLGTLGGNDSAAGLVNDIGQVAGVSYTNTTPNATTGLPTQDPFFWDRGKMVDIGTLGGTVGVAWWMNSGGQVVGQSNLQDDIHYHPFLWKRGTLTDLGTLGGNWGTAYSISDDGEATGYGTLPGDFLNGYPNYRGVLWKKGHTIDLGALPGLPRSFGSSINSSEQIVGGAASADSSVEHAMLWENGGPMVDLNDLVSQSSGVTLNSSLFINDQGVIAAYGTFSNGDVHAFVLIPDRECDGACEARITASQSATPVVQPNPGGTAFPAFGKPADWLRNPMGRPTPMLGQRPGPAN